MAIQFVIGRAGSGKTHRCFHAIVDEVRRDPLGPPIYWLLPRQATFSAERELTCNSGLGGFCRARVLSFEELGREVLVDCGGAQVPEITPGGRQMILGHLLRESQSKLKFFKSVARQPGLAARLDATFSDFERAGKNASDLDALLNQLPGGAEDTAALLDKVHDLHLIYTRYTDYLGQDRLDQHRRLLQVLSCISDSRLFRNAVIYVDGFTEFSDYERRVLARLGKVCRHVEITLPMDPRSPLLTDPHLFPDELSLFHPAEMTYRRLHFVMNEEQVPVDHPFVLLTATHRFRNKNLRELERRLFDHSVVTSERDTTGVELLEAPTRRAEVDAAARNIRGLMAKGYRLRDVAVLVRDLSDYYELIDASFREHGIPYFADRRRPTAHHPVLQLVRSVLVLGQRPWDHEWLMTLLKSGLAAVSTEDADALENYVLRHRVRGTAWAAAEPWSYEGTEVSRPEDEPAAAAVDDLGRLNDCRRDLVGRLQPFIDRTRRRGTVREVTVALFETLDRFGVRAQLADWIDAAQTAGELEQVGEHQQVWAELSELFEQLVDLLGDERVTLTGFQEIVEAGLEAFEMALTPPTVDQVLVGQADRTRTPALRAVLVLGLNEGVFPKVQREDSVLSDSDRRELHARSLDVNPATDRKLLDENLLAYACCTSASELLYASRSISDAGGKALGESVYFRRLRQMFPLVEATRLPREERDDPSLIATSRQLVTALMRWARKPPAAVENPGDPWPALYQWLAGHACCGDPLDEMRFGAWKALSYHNAAMLSPAVARRLFPAPLHVDVGQLETFAACPFRHFLRHGLRLQPRQTDDGVSAMDLGNVFHHVLDRVVKDLLRNHQSWADLAGPQRQALIRDAAQEIGGKLRGEILLSTARNRYLLQRVEKTLERVIANQASVAARGRFRPAFSRVRFGEGGVLPEFSLRTPAGTELFLRGKIDRVDVLRDGVEFAVVDYKLGSNDLKLDEVYHGIALQLLTYLLVLEAGGETLAGRKLTPAAAFYVKMLRKLGKVDHPSEAIGPDDPRFDLQVKPRGLLDGRYIDDLDTNLQGASEVINAMIRKDGSPGSKTRSDLADAGEFAALLAHVGHRLGELADGVVAGNIGIAPYMLHQATPCPRCEFHGVCRFEPSARGYNLLAPMDRVTVLSRVAEEQAGRQETGADDGR